MSDPRRPISAVNPLPAAVVGLSAVIFGLACLFGIAEGGSLGAIGGPGFRQRVVEDWAFFPQALDWMLQNRSFPPGLLARFLTYPLLSLSFMQALFVCVFILAMGKMVGEAFGNLAVLALFFGASVGGALAYGLLLDDSFPLVGGFPGVYGLIGGWTFMLWVRQRAVGESQARAFQLIAALLAIQLLFGLIFGGPRDWVADLAGFFTGFGLSFLLVPGGWARLREMLRNR